MNYASRMFKGPETDINLHVFSLDCPEIHRMLSFRDRLRSNAADRDQYARTKQALALAEWKYVQNYADAKTTVVSEIIARSQANQTDSPLGSPRDSVSGFRTSAIPVSVAHQELPNRTTFEVLLFLRLLPCPRPAVRRVSQFQFVSDQEALK